MGSKEERSIKDASPHIGQYVTVSWRSRWRLIGNQVQSMEMISVCHFSSVRSSCPGLVASLPLDSLIFRTLDPGFVKQRAQFNVSGSIDRSHCTSSLWNGLRSISEFNGIDTDQYAVKRCYDVFMYEPQP